MTCDMRRDCTMPVTHIGSKGYIYCAAHALDRRGWEHCRKLRKWEIALIERGIPLASYTPISKHADAKHREQATACK